MKKLNDNKLEQFVRENAEGFNSLDPPLMAWEAIEKELPVAKQFHAHRIWPYAWKAAAAILIFASAWMLNDYRDYKKSNRSEPSSSLTTSPELNELSDAEAYYTSQISNKQAELAAYSKLHPEIIEDLKKEFIEMDKNKAELKKDLAESNADEKVIEAIILSYRVKIEILDQMLGELRKSTEGSASQKQVETNL
jgi:hypothetical protein